MVYDLPTYLTIDGTKYAIRYDYRAVLDICIAMSDPELSDEERLLAALTIFYPEINDMPVESYGCAIKECMWFINGGEYDDPRKKSPRLVDWEQDFALICAPINRVVGKEIRSIPYDAETNSGGFHWWSFLSAYYEIGGDCTFAQVVGIRSKLSRNQKLDKSEKEWLRRNRKLVDFKTKYTETDESLIKQWT